MGKVSLVDKMRIQTLREQRLGAKAIMAAYPDKGWALSTVKKICQRFDRTGSATERKAGCDQPKSACSEAHWQTWHFLLLVGTHTHTHL